jgi:hypothetical protein
MLESSRHAGRGLAEYRTHGTVNDASMSMQTKPIDRGLMNPGVVEYPPG